MNSISPGAAIRNARPLSGMRTSDVADKRAVELPDRQADDAGGNTSSSQRPRESRAGFRIVVATDIAGMQPHLPAWEKLARSALEPNAFYEPWLLMPAIERLSTSELKFVFVYDAGPDDAAELHAFFPLEVHKTFRKLPLRVLRLWKHLHCFHCTPLVRPDRASESLCALIDWARVESGAHLLDFSYVSGDGPFQNALVQCLADSNKLSLLVSSYNRAFWKRRADLETYLGETLAHAARKEFRRQRKRLGELGRLKFRSLTHLEDFDGWIGHFLALEASGWKARSGTAITMHEDERAFVTEAARAGFGRGQVLLQGLFLDNTPLAMLLSFRAGSGNFMFKIAYDEAFAKYSPGVQLVLDLLAYVYAGPAIAWIDSCAAPDHPMINRLLSDRRIVQRLLVSTGSWRGDLALSVFPIGRWFSRLARAMKRGVSHES